MKEEPKKWSLFDIVGLYSSGVKTTLKAIKAPMKTTNAIVSTELENMCFIYHCILDGNMITIFQ